MTCERCRGWMVRDRFVDLSDDTGQLDFDGWRCINCGEVLDALVLQHRRDRPLEAYRSQRRWGTWVERGGIAESNYAFTGSPGSQHGGSRRIRLSVASKKLAQLDGTAVMIPESCAEMRERSHGRRP